MAALMNLMLPGALSSGKNRTLQVKTLTTMFCQLLFHLGLIWLNLHGELFFSFS